MKMLLIRVAAKAAPVLISIARILFSEGRNEVEITLQNAVRTVAQAVLRRYPQEA